MRKLILMLMGTIVLSCTVDNVSEEFITADAKFNKGKPQRSIYMKPSLDNVLKVAFNGRVMTEPVEYFGDLTVNQSVDWDNDGIDDEVVLNQRCFWPRSFMELSVNDEIVSYAVTFKAQQKILGFKDVNLDGFKDVIFAYRFMQPNGVVIDRYDVGYNTEGALPTPLRDIVQSLVITSSDPNPEYIKWDLSNYGYHNFVFHVYLFKKDLNDGYGYQQTQTTGEDGFYSKDRIIVGEVYIFRFINLGEDCTDIDVEFML